LRRKPPRRIIALGVAAVATLGAVGAYLLMQPPKPVAERSACAPSGRAGAFAHPAVVVLPLAAAGARNGATALADALTDRIGATLNSVPGLSVVTGPPRGHADLGKPRRQLAAELGVTHVLDGSVREEGGETTVRVTLIDGSSGEWRWSFLRSYRLTRANRQAVQSQIAIEVARAAQQQMTEGDQALHFHAYETASLAVLEHVFAGSSHLNRLTRGDNRRARREFEAALAMDARDPPANVGVAWTYATDAFFGWSATPQQDIARAERYANAAIAADPDYFYSYTVLGITSLLKGEHAAAVAYGEKAMDMSGSGADAVALLALTLSYTGDNQRGLELAQRAIRLRPYNYPIWYEWNLARARRLNGDPGGALSCLPQARLEDAGATFALVERALALAQTGDVEQARRLAARVRRQAGRRLTAENYCAHPPYATRALAQRCVSDLTRAGFPLR
jgi:TolB-like protein/Tfp pilus assembly protein PilF